MKRKQLFSLLSLFLVLLVLSVTVLKCRSKPAPSKRSSQDESYFAEFPIIYWTKSLFPTPCLNVQLENEMIQSTLDLGYRGYFSLCKELLDKTENKSYRGQRTTYGVYNHTYEKPVFYVPKLKIGDAIFHEILVEEEAEDFQINGVIIQGPDPFAFEPGRLGWEMFQNTCLFLDLNNETIACCDSFTTLQNNGYLTDSFISTPLILENGFLEILCQLPSEPLRCVLDTGCTFNVLHTPIPPSGEPIDVKEEIHFPSFQIASHEFGPAVFHPIPIELPVPIEAFLGMEFFLENMVFIDFANNLVYIAPSKSDPSSERTAETQLSEVKLTN